jgi:hypothetical protein
MIASAGIGAAGSIIGGQQASSAANRAADLQQQRYETTRGDLLPYTQAGQADMVGANRLLLGSPSQIEAKLQGMPGYQFTRYQGLKAVQNSAAARGLGVSGAALKGAAGFATGLADQTYGEQVNRLFQGAQIGENAGAQTGSAGAALAGQGGNALINGGAAAAAGTVGATGNLSQGLIGYGMYGGGGTPFVYGGQGSAMDPAFADLPPF